MTSLRVLDYAERSGSWNMALDEALLQSVISGRSLPALRFYGWTPSCLSLGYFQKIRDINISRCREEGIDIIRRPTGGRAVLHDRELTYSVVIPAPEGRSGSVLETFRLINEGILQGLESMGVAAVFHRKEKAAGAARENPYCFAAPSQFEILVQGRKAVGSAQMRREGVILQHGSIPLSVDRERIGSLMSRSDRSGDGRIVQAEDLPAGLEELLGRKFELGELVDAITKAFGGRFRCLGVQPERDELEMALRLKEEKYETESWTFRR